MNTARTFLIDKNRQWVKIQGNNPNLPLLLHVQGGPGLPMISEAYSFSTSLNLEEQFLNVYWDRRGCGKSYSSGVNSGSLNLSAQADDIIDLTEQLLREYRQQKVVLSGYSLGATLSLLAAYNKPEIFSHVFLTAFVPDFAAADQCSQQIIAQKAESNPVIHRRMQSWLKEPPDSPQYLQKRTRILADLYGVRHGYNFNQTVKASILSMMRCKEYTLTDVIKCFVGMNTCQKIMLPEVMQYAIPVPAEPLPVPIHFIHGQNDLVSLPEDVQAFYAQLPGQNKSFNLISGSAHMPYYDQPEQFRNILTRTALGH